MMRTKIVITMWMGFAVVTGACDRAENAQRPPPASTISTTPAAAVTTTVKVVVDERGYTPNTVPVARGSSVTLEFVRTTDKTCATEVVFPDLNMDRPLPLNTPVDVSVPAGDSKTYAFACGMGMHRGKVVVE